MAADQPIVDDAATLNEADRLDARLQAAVDAARARAGRRWTDDLPEHGPIVCASADPDWVPPPEPEPVTDEDLEAIEERLQVVLWELGWTLRRRSTR